MTQKHRGCPLPSALGVEWVLGTTVPEPPCRAWAGVWEAAGSRAGAVCRAETCSRVGTGAGSAQGLGQRRSPGAGGEKAGAQGGALWPRGRWFAEGCMWFSQITL